MYTNYKTLVRMVARVFYSDNIRLLYKEKNRFKILKYDTAGLMILVLDILTEEDWIDEEELAIKTKLNCQLLRIIIRFLYQEHCIRREFLKNNKNKCNFISGMKYDWKIKKTRVFVSINYQSFTKMVRLRLNLIRSKLYSELNNINLLLTYKCLRCSESPIIDVQQYSMWRDFDFMDLVEDYTAIHKQYHFTEHKSSRVNNI